MYVKDIKGKKFGYLTAIEPTAKRNRGNVVWRCQCDCGNIFETTAAALLRGTTISCGHYRRNKASETAKNKKRKTHGLSNTKIYFVWQEIKQRCNNQKRPGYKNYGGRGISICKEWSDSFELFYLYVSKLEHFGEPGFSIDRINNDGNYEPGNVRYADRKTQYQNSRRCLGGTNGTRCKENTETCSCRI